jgi:hypothetical protein
MTSNAAPRRDRRGGGLRRRCGLRIAGWIVTALVTAFLTLDFVMKLMAAPIVLETNAQMGLTGGADQARLLGVILGVSTLLYAVPRTAVLGAILLTGYLGGATAIHVRVNDPLFTHVLFGVYLGVLTWTGLFLREPRLRALIPLRSS